MGTEGSHFEGEMLNLRLSFDFYVCLNVCRLEFCPNLFDQALKWLAGAEPVGTDRCAHRIFIRRGARFEGGPHPFSRGPFTPRVQKWGTDLRSSKLQVDRVFVSHSQSLAKVSRNSQRTRALR